MTVTLTNLRSVKDGAYIVGPRGKRGRTVGIGPASGLVRGDRVYEYVASDGSVLLVRRKLRPGTVDKRMKV